MTEQVVQRFDHCSPALLVVHRVPGSDWTLLAVASVQRIFSDGPGLYNRSLIIIIAVNV